MVPWRIAIGGDRSGRLTLAAVAGAADLAGYGLTRYPELRADHGTPIWIIVLAVALAAFAGLAVVLSRDVRRMPP